MGLGARGGLSFFILGALLVLALLKAAVDSEESAGSAKGHPSTLPESTTTQPTGNTLHVHSLRNESSKSTVKSPATPVPSVIVTTSKLTAKPTSPVSSASKNGTGTTLKPTTSKGTTPGVSTTTTSTAPPKITSVSRSTAQAPVSAMTTAHNSSATAVPSSVTVTATINSKENKGAKFHIGSFIGGIALTLGILSVLYIGCKAYYSRRGIRYRTIDEHDAII